MFPNIPPLRRKYEKSGFGIPLGLHDFRIDHKLSRIYIKTRGRTLLTSDYGDVDNLDTGTISTMRYLYDFDIGDKVDMAVEAIGMVKTARITEVEEVYESGSAEIHLTMGEELLTTDKKSILV